MNYYLAIDIENSAIIMIEKQLYLEKLFNKSEQ